MADEIIYSGLGDMRAATVLANLYMLLLADRDGGALSHPALMQVGSGSPGSLVIQVPQVGLIGYDLMTDGTEGTAPANTALTDAHANITLAISEKIYQAGDLARMTDPYGMLMPEVMAADMAASVAQTLISKLAALAAGFTTNVVGSSGIDLTVQDFTDGITLLEKQQAAGRLCSILDPTQWGDMRTDSLSLGGAVQHRADSQGIVMYAGGNYKGELFGVDVFTSGRCALSDGNANTNGMIFGAGALLWGDGTFIPEPGDPNILDLAAPGMPVRGRLERDRDGRSGLTSWVMRAVLGVIEGIDAAGCRVRSDA